jgi:K(+)-stimulated pyrophosphate-energized sodium pump
VGGLEPALSVAISGGAVMGLGVVGASLIGLCAMLLFFGFEPEIINGYAMGASLVALFARSGGGIYTKGADMGADLVGKVEAGIPEDDPRNAATIADNVGDNVGDVAGLGSDLMESYVESIIAAMALAVATATVAPVIASSGIMKTANAAVAEAANADSTALCLQLMPLALAALGVLASILGVCYVKFMPGQDAQKSLMNGTYVAGFGFILLAFITCAISQLDFWAIGLGGEALHYNWFGVFVSIVSGVIAGMAVGFFSEFYTSSKYGDVRRLADESRMGSAITVTSGIGIGMKSTGFAVLALAIALAVAYHFTGYYGIAIAAFGMLATTGMIVAVDAYGPIADNAGGIAEMAKMPPEVRTITDNLDSVGNTTAAIGKGFAIGSAAFAAMGLLVAFVISAHMNEAHLTLTNPSVIAGLLAGAMLPFVFSAMLFRAVGNAAFKMIDEVRRQLREKPGIMEGTDKPDYAQCVGISTDGAIRGMLLPGFMAILVPIFVGLVFGPETLAGVLVGALASGLMLGIFCANSGGAMDNAKKYIEEGKVTNDNGVVQGKGSDAHKAAVVGDTVGDPLKDTVGPSINILIKLMAVISLVFAPMFG